MKVGKEPIEFRAAFYSINNNTIVISIAIDQNFKF